MTDRDATNVPKTSAPDAPGYRWARLYSGKWEPVEVSPEAGFYWTLGDNDHYPIADVEEWGPPCTVTDSLLRGRIARLIESWQKQVDSLRRGGWHQGRAQGLSRAADELEALLKGSE